jgi:hypothetical protein
MGQPSDRFPDLPFLPLLKLYECAQAPVRQAGGWLGRAMARPSATPPTDRRAQAARAPDAGRPPCPCPRQAPSASSSVVSQIDLSWETAMSAPRPREVASARSPTFRRNGHIITIVAGLPILTCRARTAETSRSCPRHVRTLNIEMSADPFNRQEPHQSRSFSTETRKPRSVPSW